MRKLARGDVSDTLAVLEIDVAIDDPGLYDITCAA
jgi:hypothetical protein